MASQIMPYQVTVYGVSDVGLVRPNNEDAFLLKDHFCLLADGMGGHQAGEVASKEAVDYLSELYFDHNHFQGRSLPEAEFLLAKMIQEVNKRIYQLSKEHQEWKGMGTTLCCSFLHADGLIYAHVGDSRIYHLRNNQLKQLTHDHSLLRELIDLGRLSEQQAQEFSYKNIITKAIGTAPFVEAAISHIELMPGDLILMCTDGLSDLLLAKEIQDICNQAPDSEIGEQLISRAKQKGGYDNITVVLMKINEFLA